MEQLATIEAEGAPLIANRAAYQQEVVLAQADLEAANASGDMAAARRAQAKLDSAGSQIQEIERSAFALQKKHKNKQTEINETKRPGGALQEKLNRVNQKWGNAKAVADKATQKLSKEYYQLSRKLSIQQGKAVSRSRFQPSVAELLPLDFPVQRKYLRESFGSPEPVKEKPPQ